MLLTITINNNVAKSFSIETIENGTCDGDFYYKPVCVDLITSYSCVCDVGFIWNGFSCVSTALNSYFDFTDEWPVRYAFLEKTFPTINSFTISFWALIYKGNNPMHFRTIFSYSYGENLNALKLMIAFTETDSEMLQIKLQIMNENCTLKHKPDIKRNKWVHYALTWSNDGLTKIFINGERKAKCENIGKKVIIENAGYFLLGQTQNVSLQTTQKTLSFDDRDSFIGRLFNLNVWKHVFADHEIKNLFSDCQMSTCGDAAQWSDFRQGTRGAIKLVWPTQLIWNKECLSEKYKNESCNQVCYRAIGPICRSDVDKNFEWPLTKANSEASLRCSNVSKARAVRRCVLRTLKNDKQLSSDHRMIYGEWSQADTDQCIDSDLSFLRKQVFKYHKTDNFDEQKILLYAENLLNVTRFMFDVYRNVSIHDISAIIDTLNYLANAQHQIVDRNYFYNVNNNGNYHEFINDTVVFTKTFLSIVNKLLKHSDNAAWNNSVPSGAEAIRIVKVMRYLSLIMFNFQKFLNRNGVRLSASKISYEIVEFHFEFIVYRQQFIFSDMQMPINYKFPSSQFEVTNEASNDNKGTENKKKETHTTKLTNAYVHFESPAYENRDDSQTYLAQIVFNDLKLFALRTINIEQSDFYGLVKIYYSGLEKLLPNHNSTFRQRDNNINSVIVSFDLIKNNQTVKVDPKTYNQTFNNPILISFNYTNTNNISDTRCVKIDHGFQKDSDFKWSRQGCKVKSSDENGVICECRSFGTYSITNDLYDPNWKPIVIENIPLIAISYIGCTCVTIFGIITFISLIYCKTNSATASIHKNLCISVSLLQLSVMITLTNFDYDENVCRAFSLMNHYFLIAVFAWLMNEAFNLYITITYEAHQGGTVADTSPQWRFYLIGWIIPAVIVIILLATKSNTYYAIKMCWFNLDNLWVNVSPLIGMVFIAMLVMVFSAKEHKENSYTKNKRANKLITNYKKAIWTQIVLLSASWSFMIISFLLYGTVIKYLQAFLNSLQGFFLFIFYFLLNDEVRKKMKNRKRKKSLKKNLDIFETNKSDSESDDEDYDDEFSNGEMNGDARHADEKNDVLIFENKLHKNHSANPIENSQKKASGVVYKNVYSDPNINRMYKSSINETNTPVIKNNDADESNGEMQSIYRLRELVMRKRDDRNEVENVIMNRDTELLAPESQRTNLRALPKKGSLRQYPKYVTSEEKVTVL